MQNMADVVHWIERENPFTPAFQKKVLGSVRRLKKLSHYPDTLEQIPADLSAFDLMWKRGPVRNLPDDFKSKSSFADWRSQTRSALVAFSGASRPVVPSIRDDAWSQIATDLSSFGVNSKKLISVGVLATAARQVSLTPSDISLSWLQEIIDTDTTPGHYQSIKAACKLIGKHKEEISVPLSSAFETQLHKSRSHCVRLNLPEPLATEINDWKRRRVRGERKGHRRKRKSTCSAAHAEQVVRGITYVYTAMVHADLIASDTNCSVSDMCEAVYLEEIIERELNSEFPWQNLKATTLFEYINSWRLFVRGCGHDPGPLTEVIRDFSAFEKIKSMSDSRMKWCENFLFNHSKQIAFFSLPNTLFIKAQKAMASYESRSQHEKRAAISLGIAACAAAIWTSLPLRISTLLKLTFGSADADIQIHGKRRGLVLTTPPDIVKNGYSHRYISLIPKKGGDPREIVAWFVNNIRPHLLEAYISPHLRRTDQLFGGLSYARLSLIWQTVTLDAGVPMTAHQVRHALATIMANQPRADYSIIAALLGDTEATVRKNYIFVDKAHKHEEGQECLAQVIGGILGGTA